MLEELLEVAMKASNTGNMQLYSVVVTRDAENKKRLAPAHFNQPMVTAAPVVLTFCADANRFVKWAEQRKAEAGFDNLQMFIAATIDAMLFAEAFAEAAEERGLGLCYLGTTAYNAGEIIKILSLPRLVVPIVTITVGYPQDPLPEQSERLPLEAILHTEQYADYTPEFIDRFYKEKEELEVNTDCYSLWGGSAGGRMAAWLGSYGPAAFGGDELPRPGTVLMQYTGHSDYTKNDPPTFACVGERDGIANWRTMQRRIEALDALGIPTEFHHYSDLPHGFGLGTGTVAEGWLDEAAQFWEAQM